MGSIFSCFIVKDICILKKNIICDSNSLSNIKNDNKFNKNNFYSKRIKLDEFHNNQVFFKD
jgi:hypothetical protein